MRELLPGAEFSRIEAGKFKMGISNSLARRRGHNVSDIRRENKKELGVLISKPFEIMRTEVTQKMWIKNMGDNPSKFKEKEHCENHTIYKGIKTCPDNPVENISWKDAQSFITRLNSSLGLGLCSRTPGDPPGCLRLPTEAEWEYAAKGGTTGFYFFDDGHIDIKEYAWIASNSEGKTHPVRQKKVNPYNLYDIYGNVNEWVIDSRTDINKLKSSLIYIKDPANLHSDQFVFRGGSWSSKKKYVYTAYRDYQYFNYSSKSNIGIRLVKSL